MKATTANEAWSILKKKYRGLKKAEYNLRNQLVPIWEADGDGDGDGDGDVDMEVEVMEMSMVECCIYRVPDYFKKGKEEFYRPKVISIGPVFYYNPNLQAMQELKRFYSQGFLKDPHNNSKSLEPYKEIVRRDEKKIRECYQEQINLPSDDFIEMIVLDAVFLIYYFRLFNMSRTHHRLDILYEKLGVARQWLHTDLLLEENQLPFFVLTGIYDIAFPRRDLELNQTYCPFIDLALGFIVYLSACYFSCKITNGGSNNTLSEDNIKSLVHLQIKCCYSLYGRPQNIKAGQFHEFHSAKYLSAAGVKFKLNDSCDPFDISFDERTGVLKIPKLTLYDESEDLFRIILLFEQSTYYQEVRYFADFFFFIDKLIDTVQDIQILQHNGILDNQLGSDKDAANLFNKLTKNINIILDNFTYSEVSKSLKDYSSTTWNEWKAILCSKYFNHPWAVISVIYAVILLILTVIQTISGFTSK